jgi:hypothetical protein
MHSRNKSAVIAIAICLIVLFTAVRVAFAPDAEAEGVSVNPSNKKNTMTVHELDPIMTLLGKSFDEVRTIMGNPQEEGYNDWFGPCNVMLFISDQGIMEVYSPTDLVDDIVVSMVLYSGYEFMGVRVGMGLQEIIDILGVPDNGPDLGMDNVYSMEYYYGDLSNQIPEVFVSFTTTAVGEPTQSVYIKWEAFTNDSGD